MICKQRSESENYTENKAVVGHERIPDNRKLQELAGRPELIFGKDSKG